MQNRQQQALNANRPLWRVLGVAVLFEHFGLSMALGAFLAGVLLAESEYRHEIEAAVDPFKGCLLYNI